MRILLDSPILVIHTVQMISLITTRHSRQEPRAGLDLADLLTRNDSYKVPLAYKTALLIIEKRLRWKMISESIPDLSLLRQRIRYDRRGDVEGIGYRSVQPDFCTYIW